MTRAHDPEIAINSMARIETPTLEPTQRSKRVLVYAIPDDTEGLRNELECRLGMNPIDARVRLHELPGILPQDFTPEDAESLAAAVRQFGVEAEVIDEHDCPDLTHAPTVHHVRCTKTALEVVPPQGTIVERINWDSVSLISIADVPLDGAHHTVPPQTVMVRSSPRKNDAEIETTIRGAEMWVVCGKPFRAFRIDHREMNYEYLGARKAASATANFREFAADLIQHVPGAYLTPTARAFLAGSTVEKYHLESAARHRKLVQFHAIASRRIRRSHRENTVMQSTSSQTPLPLAGLHAELHRQLDELQAWIHDADEYGRPQFGQLGDWIKNIRSKIAEHFAIEETDGYMSGPLRAAPQLVERVAELQAEHPRLLAGFDRFGQRLKECRYECWGDARTELQQLLDFLSGHEHQENELWQQAYEQDIGAVD